MVYELPQENPLEKSKNFLQIFGYKTIAAILGGGILILVIFITFSLTQTRQTTVQDASSRFYKTYRLNSKSRKPTPTPLPPTATNTPQPTASPTPLPTVPSTPTITPVTATPTNSPTQIKDDITNDGKVDIFDLSYLLSRWGTNDANADLNHDNLVNSLDMSVLLSNWTKM